MARIPAFLKNKKAARAKRAELGLLDTGPIPDFMRRPDEARKVSAAQGKGYNIDFLNEKSFATSFAGGSPTPTPTPTQPSFGLPLGYKHIDLGNSLRAAERDGSSALTFADTTNFGANVYARGKWPVQAYDLYPYNTGSIEVGYGAAEHTWGANLGLAGATIAYVIAVALPNALAMNPHSVGWGPSINGVRSPSILTDIATVVTMVRNSPTGAKLFLRTLAPVVENSTFHKTEEDPTGEGYVNAFTAVNNLCGVLAAAYPDKIALVNLSPAMCIPGTPFRKPNQTWDGTHNDEGGAAAEGNVSGPIYAYHCANPTGNIIAQNYGAAAKFFTNPTMGGYNGSRSGIPTYAGPGLSIPSGLTIQNGTAPSSAVNIGVESNPARGGFSGYGYIVGTAATIISATGTITDNIIVGGLGVVANQRLSGGGGGAGAYTASQNQATATGGVKTGSITAGSMVLNNGTGVAVGAKVFVAGVLRGTVLSGAGTTWATDVVGDVAGGTSITIAVAMNFGAQRMKITVTPAGVLTEESINIVLNPTTFPTTGLQNKNGRGVMFVEFDASPAWRTPSLSLVDRYNPGSGEVSGNTSTAGKRDTNSTANGGPGAGPFFVQTMSVKFRADSLGYRLTGAMRWNPQAAGGQPFVGYVDLLDVMESAVDPATFYPHPA